MGEQTFVKIRKTFVILLLVCFLLSVTAAAAVSADPKTLKKDSKKAIKEHKKNDHKHRGHHHQNKQKYKDKVNKKDKDYKLGDKDGATAGYIQGKYDYDNFYAYEENFDDSLSYIPISVNHKNSYIAGYEKGYQRGYDRGFP
jgi:hypothetical protein